MANPEQIELAETDIARVIEVARRQGLNSWELEDILLRFCVQLHIEATVEFRVKGG